MCGDPSDEMDHRLAIEVARALGPAAMLRAFTPENLRRLCRGCHKRKTRQDRRLAKFLSACSLDWHSARASAQAEPQVAAVVSAAVHPGIFSVADKPELMTVPCRHEVPDSSGRRYTICKKSWYFLASTLGGTELTIDCFNSLAKG